MPSTCVKPGTFEQRRSHSTRESFTYTHTCSYIYLEYLNSVHSYFVHIAFIDVYPSFRICSRVNVLVDFYFLSPPLLHLPPPRIRCSLQFDRRLKEFDRILPRLVYLFIHQKGAPISKNSHSTFKERFNVQHVYNDFKLAFVKSKFMEMTYMSEDELVEIFALLGFTFFISANSVVQILTRFLKEKECYGCRSNKYDLFINIFCKFAEI